MNMFNKGRLSKVLPFLLLAAVIASLFVYYAFAAVDRVMLDSPANGTWSASHNVTFNCTAVTNSSEVEVNVSLWMATTTAAGLTWNATNQTAATNATTIAFNITNIPDGAYLWTCEATNLSAVNPVSILRNTTNYTVYVDTAVPHTIALNSLTSGTNSTSSVLNFNWTASDAFSAFAATMTCNLTIDGVINKTIAVTNGTMANSSITGFADGRHEWNISSCNDSALNTNTTGSGMRYLYVDTAVPHTIALNSLSSGTNISSTSLNFNWTATDAGSSVMTCNLTIDGVINKTVTVASGVMSNFTVAGFAQGRHEWNISSCNDSNGFTNSSGSGLRYLYVDTAVPHTIALNSLSSGTNSTSNSLNFNWTANDTTATVMTCNLTIDSVINKTGSVVNGVMANFTVTNFTDGRHEWNISSCNDSAGNVNTTGSGMRYLYVDTAVPHTIALNSLSSGTNLSSTSLNFNWTATDAGSLVMTCNLTIDGVINKTVTVASGVMSNFTVAGFAQGRHEWNISSCNDSNGFTNSSGSGLRYLYVDTVVPHTIALNSLSSSPNSTSSVLNFNWTANDTTATVMTCNLTIDGRINKTITVTSGVMANSSITGFADGRHEWNISSCNDSALNTNTTGSEMRYLYVDTAVPHTIALNSLTDGTNLSSISPNFNWTATDAGASVMTCNLTIDRVINKTVTAASGVMSNFTVAGFAQGRHEWNISSCNDSNGFTNSSGSVIRYFTVDTVAPVITLTVSPSSVYQLTSAVTIGCDATDATDTSATSASMTVKLPNDAYSSDLDGTFTDTSLVGTYTVTCSKTDSAGNSASSSTTFSVASGSVSTGSSGGGGGGSAAPVTESRTLPSVVADTPTTFTLLSQNTIGVNEVVFTPTEGALAVAVTVSKVSSLPSTVSAAPTGEVSSYLKIEVPKLVGKVSDAKIKFEVLKSWLASKGVNANDIVLQRYTTGWDKLPTTKLREDSTKVYFEATTPGFSYFAVTTKAVAAPAGEEAEEAPAEEAPAEEAPAEAAETPAEVPAEKTGSMLWVYVVAALIVIAVAVVVIVKRKK